MDAIRRFMEAVSKIPEISDHIRTKILTGKDKLDIYFEHIRITINQIDSKFSESEKRWIENGICIPVGLSLTSLSELTVHISNEDISSGLACVYEDKDLFGELVSLCHEHADEDGHKRVIEECYSAIENEMFAIACVGLFSILDEYYKIKTGFSVKNKDARLRSSRNIRNRMDTEIALQRIFSRIRVVTYDSINHLYGNVDKRKPYSGIAQRNGVMHGLFMEKISISDCVRVILAIASLADSRTRNLAGFGSFSDRKMIA